MRNFMFALLALLAMQLAFANDEAVANTINTDMMSPEEVVLAQIEAYNNRDIDAFLSTYADDIKYYQFPDYMTLSGLDQMRRDFSYLFNSSPDLNAEIKNRVVNGNVVILHEFVTGLRGIPAIDVIAIYEVNEENKITKVMIVE